ncbi:MULTISPECIES: ribose 5-phosphate isomerase B [Geomicrobium]|uniref:Ribose 5-phosphate isomerase B n=1 Tax=Geomicrobium sediminis TaxID=1347788 RepID=A0ABS2P815_9BACL|nr:MULTISPECIES: ribose 5-phosphate isomerase B [Geomicrobium]MBM7631442.1 ribose 5-phosphate isomerase B [Geomicrobium sediminis]GAJ97304.1 ribose 5-phosphate isomerase B [Geomicrobium sp. JCM 19055]GAK07023.1 ribose 5-phosphate isomerase B [Geomicrobium sp. JCM 19038]
MKVIIGSDHAGLRLKKEILPLLDEKGIEYEDVGAHEMDSVDYPDFAKPVSEAVASGDYERGILICGTGIGMSIAANKVKGIRCALVHDLFSAEMTRLHNDSNVLAMGERVVGPGLATSIVEKWLDTPYEGGRHQRRVDKMMELDQT